VKTEVKSEPSIAVKTETPSGSGASAEALAVPTVPEGDGASAELPSGSGASAELPSGSGASAELPSDSGASAALPSDSQLQFPPSWFGESWENISEEERSLINEQICEFGGDSQL